jgi:hypothetical protein
MMNKKMIMGITSLILAFSLTACGNNTSKSNNSMNMSPSQMKDRANSNVPKGLKTAANPKYKVGSQVILHANHMPGMNGAKATVKGAYDTIVYMVNYTPTTGGKMVKNHKWVVQEEIKGAGTKPFKPGSKVTLEANHMKGMKGATAEIVTVQNSTVYMVDYTPTTGGAKVKNHKWVTESELTAK